MRKQYRRPYPRTDFLPPYQTQSARPPLGAVSQTSQNNKTPIFTFRNTAKFFAFLTIFTGAFGLCYQKGMIQAMQLGNMAGSYDAQEVFISALSGYIYIFENLTEVTAEAIFIDLFWPVCALLLILSTTFALAFQHKNRITTSLRQLKAKLFLRKKNSLSNKLHYPIAWLASLAIAGTISLIQVIGLYTMLAVFAILLLPSALGHTIGAKNATDAMDHPPCISASETNPKSKIIRQCTHLTIDGKELSGKIMLENKSGYFMRLNTGFIYASKDGKTCIYSKDTRREGKDLGKFDFDKGQIDRFCEPKSK